MSELLSVEELQDRKSRCLTEMARVNSPVIRKMEELVSELYNQLIDTAKALSESQAEVKRLSKYIKTDNSEVISNLEAKVKQLEEVIKSHPMFAKDKTQEDYNLSMYGTSISLDGTIKKMESNIKDIYGKSPINKPTQKEEG